MNGQRRNLESPFVPMSARDRLLALSVFFVLCFAVGINAVVRGSAGQLWMALALLLYVSVLAFPLVVRPKNFGWFHPLVFFVLWTFLVGVLTRLGMLLNGIDAHPALPGWESESLNRLAAYHMLLEAFGAAALYAGYALSSAVPAPAIGWRALSWPLLKIAVIAVVAVLAFGMYARATGGGEQLLLQRGLPRHLQDRFEVGGHWLMLVKLLPAACLVWLATDRKVLQRPTFYLAAALGILLVFVVTGARSSIVVPIIVGIVLWSLINRRLPRGAIVAVALVGVTLLGAIGEYRASLRGIDRLDYVQMEQTGVEWFTSGLEALEGRGAEILGTYPILAQVPDIEGLRWGETYLAFVTAFVPRALWPDKPIASGGLTAQVFFGTDGKGVPAGSVGEAYWNFHATGVALVFLLWGVLLGWMGKLYLNATEARPQIALLYVLTVIYFKPYGTAYFNWLHETVPALTMLVLLCGLPRLVPRSRSRVVPVTGG